MEIVQIDDHTIKIRQIDPFVADLLRRIQNATDPDGHPEAHDRIYSKPADESESELIEEWKLYVEPDLRQIFQTANETVANDLRGMAEEKGVAHQSWSLNIPIKHLNQWLSSLNQARLVLTAKNDFTEQEMNAEFPHLIAEGRDLQLLQVHFYGYLQEVFLELLDT